MKENHEMFCDGVKQRSKTWSKIKNKSKSQERVDFRLNNE